MCVRDFKLYSRGVPHERILYNIPNRYLLTKKNIINIPLKLNNMFLFPQLVLSEFFDYPSQGRSTIVRIIEALLYDKFNSKPFQSYENKLNLIHFY